MRSECCDGETIEKIFDIYETQYIHCVFKKFAREISLNVLFAMAKCNFKTENICNILHMLDTDGVCNKLRHDSTS